MSNKKTVQYRVTPHQYIVIGDSAVVTPVDHPGSGVVNGLTALTSVVESYNPETGEFETKNTRYVVEGTAVVEQKATKPAKAAKQVAEKQQEEQKPTQESSTAE